MYKLLLHGMNCIIKFCYQSNPAAKLLSIAGDMSLAALIMHLSAWDFLQNNDRRVSMVDVTAILLKFIDQRCWNRFYTLLRLKRRDPLHVHWILKRPNCLVFVFLCFRLRHVKKSSKWFVWISEQRQIETMSLKLKYVTLTGSKGRDLFSTRQPRLHHNATYFCRSICLSLSFLITSRINACCGSS